VYVRAGTSVSLHFIEALAGHVALIADAGDVNGKSASLDVVADGLSVSASGGVGTAAAPLLVSVYEGSLQAGVRGVHVQHSDRDADAGLTIVGFNNVPFASVRSDAGLNTFQRSQSGITTSGGGDLNVSVASNLTVSSAVSVAGKALLQAGDSAVVGVNTGIVAADRISLSADLISVSAAVQSTGQRVSMLAQSVLEISRTGSVQTGPVAGMALLVNDGSLNLRAGGLLSAGSGGLSVAASAAVTLTGTVNSDGTVNVSAGTGLSMVSGSGSSRAEGSITATDDVRLQAGTGLDLGFIQAIGHNVALIAGASVNDGDSAVDIIANGLYLQTGSAGAVGSGSDLLDINVSTLALSVGSGGAYVSEAEGLTIDTVSVAVSSLALDGTQTSISNSWEDLTLANGALVLQVLAGDLVVNAGANGGLGVSLSGATSSAGRLLLQSLAGAVTLNAGVTSTHGPVSLLAATDLSLDEGGDVVGGGTVDLLAGSGSLLMSSVQNGQRTERSITAAGDVRMEASANIGVGLITATNRNVALIAGGSITDGDDAVDVVARGLYLQTGAAGGVGSGSDALDTSVDRLALSAGSAGAYVNESNGLAVDPVEVSVTRLAADGSSSTAAIAVEDLVIANGTLVLQVLAGDLLVNAGSAGTAGVSAAGANGQVLLNSVAGGLTLNAGVQSELGAIGLQAQTGMTLAAGGNVTGGASVDLLVRGGSVVMSSTTDSVRSERSITAAGDVRMEASANIGVGLITATNRNVALIAGASISDGDDAVDVIARGLYLQTGAAGGVGLGSDALDTSVDRLALSAGSAGAYVNESNGLAVDTVEVSVTRLASDGSSSTAAIVVEDLVIANGTLVLQVLAGDLLVNAGSVTGGASVDVLVRGGSLAMASGTGDGRTERGITAAGDVRLEASVDLGLGLITAANHNVALVAGGSISDGDAAVDVVARGLYLETGNAGGVGSLNDVLEIELDADLGSLSGDVGAAGLHLQQSGKLRVDSLQSAGAVNLKAEGDLLLGRLNAPGQVVTLESLGAVLPVGAANADGSRLVADDLVVNAVSGLGGTDSPVVADVGTLTAAAGNGGVFFEALGNVRVLSISGTDSLEVSSPNGAFEASSEQDFERPLVVRSAEVRVDAPLSGERIDVQTPVVLGNAKPLPLVIGARVPKITPEQGVFLDKNEVANLRFDDIVMGSAQAGQEIWLQTNPDDPNDKLKFEGRLTLNAQVGETRFSGLIEGQGLTLEGRGNTTYFHGADKLHSRSVTINDALDVTASSILEVADNDPDTHLVLTLNGNITVRAGQSLQLLADEIRFGVFPGAVSASIVLEAGATLVLGSDKITVTDSVRFDSQGGHLVLRGAPSATAVSEAGLMDVNFVPGALNWDAAATDALVAWLAADTDGGLISLTLGDDAASTLVASASVFNVMNAGTILLRGDEVHLGGGTGPAWTLQKDTVVRAASGNLSQRVDLLAENDLSLVANQGAISMDVGRQIVGNGAVALTATTGIAVAQIHADQRIDLFSPGGQIRAVASLDGQAHLNAPAVSFYGYGPTMPLQGSQSVMVVDTKALQVAAPTGLAARGFNADGSVYYRAVDKGQFHHQLQVYDQLPQRVMISRTDLQSQAVQLAQSQPLSSVWPVSSGFLGWASGLDRQDDTAISLSAVQRYLASLSPELPVEPDAFLSNIELNFEYQDTP
jgi:hypothetical protein